MVRHKRAIYRNADKEIVSPLTSLIQLRVNLPSNLHASLPSRPPNA